MLLNTYSNDLLWIKPFNRKQSISLGIHQDVQTNRNIGSRMIVPDANSFENAIFAYFKSKNTRLAYEGGLRYSHKKISTFETGTINTALDNPGTSILPFSRWYQSLTGALGLSWKVAEKWRLKTNLSSGFRPGNLAELSSNGLHEGSLRYEIGSINLKMEQNLCADISLSYVGQHFSINTTAYANRFFNYIYLNPTGEEYIGFQIFEFIQKNALLKGTEATLEIHPKTMSWLNLRTSYSNVIGSTDEGNSLPFIPAGNIKNSVELKAKKSWKIGIPTLQLTINHCFAQNRPGQFETATPAYTLLDGGIGTQLKLKNKSLTLSLSGQNLLNTTYYTHLSRYKYYGINDRGRSIVLFIKLSF